MDSFEFDNTIDKDIKKADHYIENNNTSDNQKYNMTNNNIENHKQNGITIKSEHAVLDIRNLVFSYPKSLKIILNNIKLSIPRDGYSVGIVGPSG